MHALGAHLGEDGVDFCSSRRRLAWARAADFAGQRPLLIRPLTPEPPPYETAYSSDSGVICVRAV